MSELAIKADNAVSQLDSLAVQARECVSNLAENTLKLGEVLTNAKPLVKHGEWEKWVLDNTNFSLRSAQQFMQAYQRFGTRSDYATIERGKIISMMMLPAGTEDQFREDNNIDEMTAREVKKAVDDVRAEYERKLQAARSSREMSDSVKTKLSEQAATIEDQKQEISRLQSTAQISLDEKNRAITENNKLRRDASAFGATLQQLNDQLQDAHERLANAQSQLAKGDAERTVSGILGSDQFVNAANQFMGVCGQMPLMANEFASMALNEKNQYERMLKRMEEWCAASRKAISAVKADGEVK